VSHFRLNFIWIFKVQRGDLTGSHMAVILQALEFKTLILLIDGVDEASEFREDVQDFVLNGLHPLGVRLVVTSRPEGILDLPAFLKKRFLVLIY
jgi:hypothetical protein